MIYALIWRQLFNTDVSVGLAPTLVLTYGLSHTKKTSLRSPPAADDLSYKTLLARRMDEHEYSSPGE